MNLFQVSGVEDVVAELKEKLDEDYMPLIRRSRKPSTCSSLWPPSYIYPTATSANSMFSNSNSPFEILGRFCSDVSLDL